jgi:sugar phosphate isomerase/epimerase
MTRRFAAILGNLGNTRDRFCAGYKDNPPTMAMLERAASIPSVTGIELVGTWDISPDNVTTMRSALRGHGLECVSIIPDLFANRLYAKGSFSSADAAIRRHAIDYTRRMCDVAGELGCPTMNLWPGQDGYDYLLCADLASELGWISEAVYELASAYPELRFALEFKPKEPRTHSYLARSADTLLLVNQIGLPNVGITIDTGHSLVGGETIAEAVVLASRYGDRLFHMHFNDNYLTTDDDMIVGSVHTVGFIEALYWLDRCGYDGWFSMDQYPYREDAAGAIEESILWLTHYSELVDRHREAIDTLIGQQDPIATSRYLRKMLTAELAPVPGR